MGSRRPESTVRVGALGPGDAGEVLTVQYAAYVGEARRYREPDIPPLRETLDALRADLAGTGPRLVALGAWIGPRLVGSVRGRVDGALMEVARFTVAPDLQGRGIGRALIEALHGAAPEGVRTAWLVTGGRSTDNLRFYAAAGYRETGTTVDDVGVMLVRMERELPVR